MKPLLFFGGPILLIAGVIASLVLWVPTGNFWLVFGTAFISQAAAGCLGAIQWKSVMGKLTTIASALLLTLTATFFAVILLLAWSADIGAPM